MYQLHELEGEVTYNTAFERDQATERERKAKELSKEIHAVMSNSGRPAFNTARERRASTEPLNWTKEERRQLDLLRGKKSRR